MKTKIYHTGLEERSSKRCTCHKKGASWKITWLYGEEEVTLHKIYVEPSINETQKYSVKEGCPTDRFRIHTMNPRVKCSACGRVVPKSSILPMDSPLVHPGTGKPI